MQETKLIALLSSLDSRELSRFADFVHSPYFNKHEQIMQLCTHLLSLAPSFQHPRKLEKTYIFQKLYPNKKYEDAALHSLFSKLLKLLQLFLAEELLQENELQIQLNTLYALRKRKLEKHYHSILKRCDNLVQDTHLNTAELSLRRFQLFEEQDRWFLVQGGRTYDESLQLASDQLDVYYWVQKLRIACDMTNRNNIIKANYQCHFVAECIEYLDKNTHLLIEYPVLFIYQQLLFLLKDPQNNLLFPKLIHSIQELSSQLTIDEKKSVYDYALNYCVKQINEGNSLYYSEVLKLYQTLLPEKLIYIDGYLPAWEYKNIMTAAIRTSNFEWANWFLEAYIKEIEPEIATNAYPYNKAALLYAEGKHNLALQSLFEVDFIDHTYHIGAKIIQIKIYFETDAFEALFSSIDALTAYIKRHKELGEYQQKASLHFLQIAKKISKLKEEMSWNKSAEFEKKGKELLALIERKTPLSNKDWLIEICQKFLIEW